MATLISPDESATQDPLQQQALSMRTQITAQMVALLRTAWLAQKSTRTATDRSAFQRQAESIIRAAQHTVVALQGAYLSRSAELAGQTWRAATVAPSFFDTLRTGVDFSTEYERPFNQLYSALAAGANYSQAVQAGLTRLETLAKTDLQLASSRAGQSMVADQPGASPDETDELHIVGYERVTTSGHPCALCLIASTQRYHIENLMPIHPGCQCIVEAIWGMGFTPRVINPALLKQVHQAIKDEFGTKNPGATNVPGQDFDYKDVLIVQHNGELGPVLAVRGQNWMTKAQAYARDDQVVAA